MSRSTSRQRSSLPFRAATAASVGLASLGLVSSALAAGSPIVTTGAAPVRQTDGNYQLSGTVNANGYTTNTKIEYGQTIPYNFPITTQLLQASWTRQVTGITDSAAIQPGVTYHYRTVAQNSAGITNGPDQTFIPTAKPRIGTDYAPIRRSDGSYQLNGEVDPGGLSTTTQIWYGIPGSFQFGPSGPTLNPIYQPGSTQSFAVYTSDTVLTPGAVYHYYVKATNSLGTTTGPDHSFTATAKPVVTAGAAPVRQSDGTYTLSANVNPAGLSTTTQIWLGTSTSYTYGPYGPTLSPTTTPGTAQPISVLTDFTTLTPGVTYHYRAQATNSLGTTYGPDQTFVAS